MTIKEIFDDSDEIASELRRIAAQMTTEGNHGDAYWLKEAATHIEGLYQRACALEKA
jgi:uncharacterized membrane protein